MNHKSLVINTVCDWLTAQKYYYIGKYEMNQILKLLTNIDNSDYKWCRNCGSLQHKNLKCAVSDFSKIHMFQKLCSKCINLHFNVLEMCSLEEKRQNTNNINEFVSSNIINKIMPHGKTIILKTDYNIVLNVISSFCKHTNLHCCTYCANVWESQNRRRTSISRPPANRFNLATFTNKICSSCSKNLKKCHNYPCKRLLHEPWQCLVCQNFICHYCSEFTYECSKCNIKSCSDCVNYKNSIIFSINYDNKWICGNCS